MEREISLGVLLDTLGEEEVAVFQARNKELSAKSSAMISKMSAESGVTLKDVDEQTFLRRVRPAAKGIGSHEIDDLIHLVEAQQQGWKTIVGRLQPPLNPSLQGWADSCSALYSHDNFLASLHALRSLGYPIEDVPFMTKQFAAFLVFSGELSALVLQEEQVFSMRTFPYTLVLLSVGLTITIILSLMRGMGVALVFLPFFLLSVFIFRLVTTPHVLTPLTPPAETKLCSFLVQSPVDMTPSFTKYPDIAPTTIPLIGIETDILESKYPQVFAALGEEGAARVFSSAVLVRILHTFQHDTYALFGLRTENIHIPALTQMAAAESLDFHARNGVKTFLMRDVRKIIERLSAETNQRYNNLKPVAGMDGMLAELGFVKRSK